MCTSTFIPAIAMSQEYAYPHHNRLATVRTHVTRHPFHAACMFRGDRGLSGVVVCPVRERRKNYGGKPTEMGRWLLNPLLRTTFASINSAESEPKSARTSWVEDLAVAMKSLWRWTCRCAARADSGVPWTRSVMMAPGPWNPRHDGPAYKS